MIKKPKTTQKNGRMTAGSGWRLFPTKGRDRVFSGTLLWTHMVAGRRIAIFSVPIRKRNGEIHG